MTLSELKFALELYSIGLIHKASISVQCENIPEN